MTSVYFKETNIAILCLYSQVGGEKRDLEDRRYTTVLLNRVIPSEWEALYSNSQTHLVHLKVCMSLGVFTLVELNGA